MVHYIKNRVICAIVQESHIGILFKTMDDMFSHLVVKFIHKILRGNPCDVQKSNFKIQRNDYNSLSDSCKAPSNSAIL